MPFLICAGSTLVGCRVTRANLVRALEPDEKFAAADLDDLSCGDFDVAIGILEAWQRDPYYSGKAKLRDLSVQVESMASHSIHNNHTRGRGPTGTGA